MQFKDMKHFSKYNSFYLQMYQILSAKLSDMLGYSMLEIITYNMENELIGKEDK